MAHRTQLRFQHSHPHLLGPYRQIFSMSLRTPFVPSRYNSSVSDPSTSRRTLTLLTRAFIKLSPFTPTICTSVDFHNSVLCPYPCPKHYCWERVESFILRYIVGSSTSPNSRDSNRAVPKNLAWICRLPSNMRGNVRWPIWSRSLYLPVPCIQLVIFHVSFDSIGLIS